MLQLKGEYGEATVFTDVVDNASISQVMNLLNQPYVAGSRIRMMPDIHAGSGCAIGTTMTIGDKICPNLVGVDIGCGMETVRIRENHLELQKLDKLIRQEIPSGFAIRTKPHRFAKEVDLQALHCAKHLDLHRAECSIGTLGGGNHFIEVDQDDQGNLYLIIHSGSRHLGLEVCNFYQNAGHKALTVYSDQERKEIIAQLKLQGKAKDIQKAMQQYKLKPCSIPKALAYVEGELLQMYLEDMAICQRFANLNRKAMVDEIVKGMGLHVLEQFTTIHNYIDIPNRILRKGAVSAQAGERLLIPINMRDGSLLCTGKGNEDWNFSAPHGAGRLMSRGEAKDAFTVTQFKAEMEGIYSTSVGRSTIDESPMAYKRLEDIVDYIDPTVTIDAILKPIYNFKAGSGE